ncbi:MAG: hypothetical protein NVSMB47_02470 [Polyangiales bacterium]
MLKLLVAMGATAGMLSWIPSCRDNNETIFIRQLQLPAAPDCIAKPDPTSTFIARGVLDVALSSHYQVIALVGNQMVSRGDYKQTRAEPNRVLFKGADIHLLDDKQKEIGFYQVIANGEVDPQTSGDATYGLAAFDLIPPVQGDKIRAAIVASGGGTVQTYEARFKVFGTTLGGTEVTTGEYAFAIDTCYGCTVIYPSDANEPSLAQPNCKKVQTGGVTTIVGGPTPACLAGPDGVTDCRSCQGNPVCAPCRTDADCSVDFKGSHCAAGHCT